jgi:hypothetical protein
MVYVGAGRAICCAVWCRYRAAHRCCWSRTRKRRLTTGSTLLPDRRSQRPLRGVADGSRSLGAQISSELLGVALRVQGSSVSRKARAPAAGRRNGSRSALLTRVRDREPAKLRGRAQHRAQQTHERRIDDPVLALCIAGIAMLTVDILLPETGRPIYRPRLPYWPSPSLRRNVQRSRDCGTQPVGAQANHASWRLSHRWARICLVRTRGRNPPAASAAGRRRHHLRRTGRVCAPHRTRWRNAGDTLPQSSLRHPGAG